jgi:chloramphenicol 3-O-phosphotransferase
MELIFLHGRPAAGKLTVARALSERLHYPVFHNHLVVNLLTEVFPFGSDPFVRLREQMWMWVFTDAAVANTSIIFTFAPDRTVKAGFPSRVQEAVENDGGRVCFVGLLVSDAEQERRIMLPIRRELHKLSDVETLRSMRGRYGFAEQPPSDFTIDTELDTVEEAADAIIGHFHLAVREPIVRFPDDL